MNAKANSHAKVLPGCLRSLISLAMANIARRKPTNVSRWGTRPLVKGCSDIESIACLKVSIAEFTFATIALMASDGHSSYLGKKPLGKAPADPIHSQFVWFGGVSKWL